MLKKLCFPLIRTLVPLEILTFSTPNIVFQACKLQQNVLKFYLLKGSQALPSW